MDNVLLYFSLKYNGEWTAIYQALDEKEKIESSQLIKVNQTIKNNFISIINPLYPSSLKQITEPSFVIYFKGSISLLHNYHKTIAFIGGDTSNEYNSTSLKKIIEDLIAEQRILLLTDQTPLQTLILSWIIQHKGKVIITTALPLEQYLQASAFVKLDLEQADYLILSETETSTMFEVKQVVTNQLNSKLINGLSKAVVVLENHEDASVNACIKDAIQEEKKLFAIPQPIVNGRSSSNQIIKQKASLIENAFDILNQI